MQKTTEKECFFDQLNDEEKAMITDDLKEFHHSKIPEDEMRYKEKYAQVLLTIRNE